MKLFAAHLALPALLGSILMAGAAAQSVADQSASGQAASSASPQPPAETAPFPARLSDVEGSVHTARMQPQNPPQTAPTAQLPPPPPPDQAFRAALVNTPVPAGTEVDTGSDGRAELQFNDGNIARITPNSAVEVVALPNGGEQLRALRGLSYFEIPDSSTGVMRVAAGAYGVRLEQNSLVRFDLDTAPFQVAVIRGAAHVTSSNSDVGFEATEGQTAALDPSSPTSYDLNQEVANNSWDAWNTDRDQTLAQLAETETNARAGSGDENSPGWNDLDYYGTWYNVPGAGMAWAPDGVDASFDPYGAGAWTSYPGVGPTWVSAYPWGWLPYHCGGWNYFSGFGWGWQPGGGGGYGGDGGGVGWYPYTGVHNAPRDYRIPLPLDPRLRTRLTGTPLPPSRAVTIHRAPGYRFRPIGGARPEPRAFPLANNTLAGGSSAGFAPTLPPVGLGFAAAGRRAYQPGTGLHGGPGSGVGGGMHNNHIDGGRGVYTPGLGAAPGLGATPGLGAIPGSGAFTPRSGAITPPPHVLAAPRNSIAPPPHVVAPPAVHYASPPAAAAPRVAAPAAPAGAPRGH